jgi:hypothetical protein
MTGAETYDLLIFLVGFILGAMLGVFARGGK